MGSPETKRFRELGRREEGPDVRMQKGIGRSSETEHIALALLFVHSDGTYCEDTGHYGNR
jgi:hypothetical protein